MPVVVSVHEYRMVNLETVTCAESINKKRSYLESLRSEEIFARSRFNHNRKAWSYHGRFGANFSSLQLPCKECAKKYTYVNIARTRRRLGVFLRKYDIKSINHRHEQTLCGFSCQILNFL